MNNKIRFSSIIDSEKDELSEIKDLLSRFIGGRITFNQFTGILDKDNGLQYYNRNTLLHRRRKFFKEGCKRGRGSPKEISMPLGKFVDFLGTLARDSEINLDLGKFRKALDYCMALGYIDKK